MKHFNKRFTRRAAWVLAGALTLSACGSGGGGGGGSGSGESDDTTNNEQSSGAPETLSSLASTHTITDYVIVSSKKIDSTTVEYTYSARLVNFSMDQKQVVARLSNPPANILSTDEDLVFDDVKSNSSTKSSDTFILQQKIDEPFHVEDLKWQFEYEQTTNLQLKSDATKLRMTVGESRDVVYTFSILNGASTSLSVDLTETPAESGLVMASDNNGTLEVEAGLHTYTVSQTIKAEQGGTYRTGLTVSIPGESLSSEWFVDINVVADDDGDGIENSVDLCPSTSPGQKVGSNGCANGEAEDTSNFLIIKVGDLEFKARHENVSNFDDGQNVTGLQVTGNLLLASPMGDIVIFGANLIFEYGANLTDIERIRGTAQVPFPAVGMLEGVEIGTPAMADVGLDYGVNLDELEAPLKPNRQYLFFKFNAGFEASAGPISFEAPGGKSITFVLDPLDPFFFLTGSLPGLDEVAGVSDLGIGMSLQGNIPFAPETTWGIDGDIGTFDAHLYLQGEIPLARLPLSIDGVLAANLDPDKDGATIFNDQNPDMQFGGNGTLNVSVDFLKFFSFGFPLGNASLGIQVQNDVQNAYISGELDPDTSFIPQELVPIQPSSNVKMAGLISSDIKKSYLKGEGEYNLNASNLSDLVGITLNDLAASEGTLNIDSTGFKLTAKTSANIHPAIDLGGSADLTARFTGDPSDWMIGLHGNMSIAGVGLEDSGVTIDTSGLSANGSFVTPISRVSMSGDIDASGVDLRGRTELTIPVSGVEQVLEWVVDGAYCGYDKVTSAAKCGVDTVKDAAICGTKTITDGAICGYKTITSIFECGINLIGGAKTCKIANSCKVANTCSVPKSCNIAKGCNKTTNIDISLGDVKAVVDLKIGSSGLGGTVSGEYCHNSNCQTLGGGQVKASASGVKACITIPAGVGEVCGKI
ncbi:MAG: hypothetical protein OEY52_12580 [Gammaproteobacteria bacterium]|nr:hypothetical protein [Gammaproteobacteria bacterium]